MSSKLKIFGDFFAEPERLSSGSILAGKALLKLEPDKAISLVVETLLERARQHNDEDCKKLLYYLRGTFINKHCCKDSAYCKDWNLQAITAQQAQVLDKAIGEFLDRLMDLYFEIDWYKEVRGCLDPALPKTKLELIQFVITRWKDRLTPNSIRTLDFLNAVLRPNSANSKPEKNESVYRAKSRGGRIQREEKDEILHALYEHVKKYWDASFLENWIGSQEIEPEIGIILRKAWGEKCGPVIFWESIKARQLLEGRPNQIQKLSKLSPAGKGMMSESLQEIQEWDEAVNKLRDSLEKERASIDEFVKGIVEKETLEKSAIKSIQIAYDKKPDPRLLIGNEKRDILITLLMEPGIKSSSFFADMRDEMQKVISEWITDNLRKHAGRDLVTSVLVLECEGQIVAWDRVG